MRLLLSSLALCCLLAGCSGGSEPDPYAGKPKPETTVNEIQKEKNPDGRSGSSSSSTDLPVGE